MIKIQKITRDRDIINGSKDLEYLYTFKEFPVFMGCTNQNIKKDIFFDMQWKISKSSGVIQLDPLLPLNVLYPESHGSGNIGSLWLEHHQRFSKFIQKQNPKSVLEIGGLHGILSREYMKENPIDWKIIEPNPSPGLGVKAKFIKGFFDEKFTLNYEIDTIIHSHVFEHIYNPNEFISQISNFLKNDQKLIFSVPNMEEMLKKKYTNCLNFEHTIFLTEPYINYLLEKYGFKLIDKEYFKKDHSIFYTYHKSKKINTIAFTDILYEHNKKIFLDFIEYHKLIVDEINNKINNTPSTKKIYLFGAHIFSQYLFIFGLNANKITCLLDNDPDKHDKRLYGSNLRVDSPNIIKDIKNPIVILKAGVYNNEIKSDILANINSNTEFWM